MDGGYWKNLKSLFGIDFHSLSSLWDHGYPYRSIRDLFNNEMDPAAGDVLGSSWSTTDGTDGDNNGFDLLFATLGILNNYNSALGMTSLHQNKGIVMGGYYWLGIPVSNPDILFTTLHETLHTYNAVDLSDLFYIMTENQFLSGNWMSGTTYTLVNGAKNKYDGV